MTRFFCGRSKRNYLDGSGRCDVGSFQSVEPLEAGAGPRRRAEGVGQAADAAATASVLGLRNKNKTKTKHKRIQNGPTAPETRFLLMELR